LRLFLNILVARNDPNAVVVGFYGQPLVPIVQRRFHRPILFDAFISTYDTLCFDRQMFAPGSIPGRLALWLDQLSCREAALVLLDTQAHADYFHRVIGVPSEKLRVLPVSCNEELFFPRPHKSKLKLTVLHYGSYQPLHGIETIIEAASLLANDPRIQFQLVGSGSKLPAIRNKVAQLALKNVEFQAPVPIQQLPDVIANADICLGGHFGASDKAARVIPGKTYQCLAMAKPVIAGENPANRELLTPGIDALYCKMNDPYSLAEAIRILAADGLLRSRLGEAGRNTFLRRASLPVLSQQLASILKELLGES
jgi:glycosyltransferase involved in cell wall biosynthesis